MNKETCRHGLSLTEHHCPLCMHEGKGARPEELDMDLVIEEGVDSELMRLRQQLAESERQREELQKAFEYWRDEYKRADDERSLFQARISVLTDQLAQYQREANQAEPVAYLRAWERRFNGGKGVAECDSGLEVCEAQDKEAFPVYTTPQPAAVALVLPEEMKEHPHIGDGYRNGWNDCCEEVRRLNTEIVTVQELARLRGSETDAVRYRKLRAMHWTDKILTVAHPKYVSLGAQTYSGDMLDAAIDAIRTNGENDE